MQHVKIPVDESKFDFILKSKIELININIERDANYVYLKPLQMKSIKAAMMGDVLSILPTGYGKSLIFEMITRLKKSKTIVISPLNAIIEQQVQKLGDKAINISSDFVNQLKKKDLRSESVNRFLKGEYIYLFGHPEQILRKEICDILRREDFQDVKHIIIDEAHCVVKWGYDFRPEFQNISKLRAVFPIASLVALTATATVSMQREIIKILCMKNTTTICSSIDRPNVKIIVEKRPSSTGGKASAEDSVTTVLEPYVTELCSQPHAFPKTIIYAKLKWCGIGYDMVLRKAKCTDNCDGIMSSVSQYHAPCKESVKKDIVKAMSDPEGEIKMLFATEAYGMGADAPDVRRVVHIGPPNSLETYIQEIGRAGRDGEKSEACLYFNMADIGTNTNIKPEMREFCLLDSCRRRHLCDHFASDFLETNKPHECCDRCTNLCDCDICFGSVVDAVCIEETSWASEESTDLKCLRELLESYFLAENEIIGIPNPELLTCLTSELITLISTNFTSITREQDLSAKFPLIDSHYIHNIWNIISNYKK